MRSTRFVLALAALLAWPGAGMAQNAIVSDGRMAPTPSVVGFCAGCAPAGGDAYTITGGAQRGNNLFHSFSDFNVPSFGQATFDGPASIQNVLSRVTGTNLSMIDGTISTRTAMPSANFFLINPNGVMFGPSAALDVGGAFHASTANYIKLDDGSIFAAAPAANEVLTSAAPQAFGFLPGNTGSIVVDGAQLFVDPGQTLSLIGGNVQVINGGVLAAFGGLVQIVSVASPGEVVLTAPDLNLPSFAALGDVNIESGAFVAANGDFGLPGGTVRIRSGRLIVDGGTITNDAADVMGAPIGIDISATDSMVVRNGGVVHTGSTDVGDASNIAIKTGRLTVELGGTIESQAVPPGTGKTGSIDIQATSVDVSGGGLAPGGLCCIFTNAFFAGDAGGISIHAPSGTINIAGAQTEVFTQATQAVGVAAFGGDISLTAQKVVLDHGAKVRSGSPGGAQSGTNVSITASEAVTISDFAGIDTIGFTAPGAAVAISTPQLVMNSSYIKTTAQSVFGAGHVQVDAGSVSLTNGAQIATNSALAAAGSAGSMTINGSGSITISGVAAGGGVGGITFTNSANSGLFSTAAGTGDAGQIVVSTPSLTVADGGKISVATSAGGKAGTVTANAANIALSAGQITSSTTAGGAGGAITINGTNVSIGGAGGGLFSTTSSTGNAGTVSVTSSTLDIGTGGKISASTSGSGRAGTISPTVGTLTLSGGGTIESSTNSGGAGGAINVQATNLSMAGAGTALSSTAQSTGNAGQITLSGNTANVTDSAKISVTTGGVGNAGTITANVASINVSGGQITSSTTAGGAGGSIALNGTNVSINGAGGGLFSTAASTGNAGTISVAASTLGVGNGGKISASTSGAGNAGTISTNVGTLSMSTGGVIESSTVSAGAGGSISVQANSLSMSDTGTAISSTASGSGNAGQITLAGGSANVSNAARISVTTSGAGRAGTITANLGSVIVSGGQLDSSTSGSGAGGAINVTAATEVSVLSGGRVSADSTGTGFTGNILLASGDHISILGGNLSTRALTSDGGNIELRAPKIIRIEDSQIATSVQSGVGAGGNITVDPQFLIINNSTISANAFGGPGGNITIIADNFISTPTAVLTASSALSTPGTIVVRSPENNLASSVAQLPRAFTDASRLMRGACSARHEGLPSSFTLAGRGGVPPEADGYLPSMIAAAPSAPLAFALARLDDCAR